VIQHPVNSPEAWSLRAHAFADPAEACGWSRASQRERFAFVLDALAPKPGERLLDYGCGTGALADLLPSDVDYLGFDWATGMVTRAAREHPGRTFTTFRPAGRFDLVACVGVFNLPGNWSKQHTFHTLRHLWDTTGCRALAASLYAGEDENCLSYTEDELDACGRTLAWDSRVVRIRHNDLLLVVRSGSERSQ